MHMYYVHVYRSIHHHFTTIINYDYICINSHILHFILWTTKGILTQLVWDIGIKPIKTRCTLYIGRKYPYDCCFAIIADESITLCTLNNKVWRSKCNCTESKCTALWWNSFKLFHTGMQLVHTLFYAPQPHDDTTSLTTHVYTT